jgi:hypothetical protein
VIQGAFPPTCRACDVTPLVVAGAFAPASDFVNPNGSPNFDPTADPLFSASFGDPSVTQQGPSVPEIPPQATLLIGFAGLALVGRLWGQCVSDSFAPSRDKLNAALHDTCFVRA